LTLITDPREQDMRAYLNGHRSKASAAAYNQRHIREAADQAIRELQSGLIATSTSRRQSGNEGR